MSADRAPAAGASSATPRTVVLSLVSHTNVGKTTLARTLLRREVGEVFDHAHVTDETERFVLLGTAAGERVVLADTPGWDRTVIDTAVASGAETRVDLAAPLSVHVVYLTAYPGPDGAVAYSADIYQRDPALLEALDTPALMPAALPPG